MDGLGDDGLGFDPNHMMMNQQQHEQQFFGSYSQDGPQMAGLAGSMYPDDSALAVGDDANDANDAKRRRIARVRTPGRKQTYEHWLTGNFDYRRAICVGRKRSSATARCPSARTVSTIRRIVSLLKLRRNEILRKGMLLPVGIAYPMDSDLTWIIQREIHRGFGKPPGPHGIPPPIVWSPLRRR
jgi:hypothetical protein